MTKTTLPKHLVVYADDDIDDLRFVEQSFSEMVTNVELVTLNDGVGALEYLSELSPMDSNPCLIILDINMPRLDGKEALQRIRQMERFQQIPVVLFSTSSLEQDRAFALRHNAGFMTKPLDSRQMQRITEQFIEHCDDEIRRNIQRKLS